MGIGISRLFQKYPDQYGNKFRYRGKVTDGNGRQLGRWAWDVFLLNN